jgi:uncharacterized protein (DUF305 family)
MRLRSLAPLAAALGLAACAGASSPAGEAPAPASDSPDRERLEAIYQARADSARMDVHPADVRFMTGMIAHHAQAVLMSHWAPAQAGSASIRTLAARITNAQKDEIGLMQRWLRERDRPVPRVDEQGRVHGHGEHMHMAGMLSREQLDALEASRGETYDSLYLKYMIPHHEGAVTMVRELFATDGAALDDFVFKLASDIQVDQSSEIARMQRMLDAMRTGARR